MSIKILTVDDSKTIRMIVNKSFKPFDCVVYEAANGIEGLSVASRERPDIIILDLTMPVMDGVEMLSKLKSSTELKSIPVIMLTAEAGRENVLKIAKLGVRDYLVKPFREDILLERVGRVIELKPKGETVARTKRFDDPLRLLLVDDKPAILDQLRAGLAADNAGLTLHHLLRASTKTKNIPIFGLVVKTAVEDQSRGAHAGLTGIITKPIDFDDLKGKISRALHLDASYKYFRHQGGVLILTLPACLSASVNNEISHHLRAKVAEAVDAGLDKMIIDLTELKASDINVIKLCLSVIQLCKELSIKERFIGPDAIREGFKTYEETKDWRFASSFDEAFASPREAVLSTA